MVLVWYGKGPGVDRSMDVIKHANAFGTSRYGGVLPWQGMTTPASPLRCPISRNNVHWRLCAGVGTGERAGGVGPGIFGWELSGIQVVVGLKAITENMDSAISADIDSDRVDIIIPEDFELLADGVHARWPDKPLEQELRLNKYKIYAARNLRGQSPESGRIG